jgi:hypothetical protein
MVRRIPASVTIFCKLCHQPIRSTKPDLEAQAAVLTEMGNHLGAIHREQAVQLAELLTGVQNLAATYLLIKEYVEIPAEEKALLESFEQNEQTLIEALGLQIPPMQAKSRMVQ